jgi:hypothetical protein
VFRTGRSSPTTHERRVPAIWVLALRRSVRTVSATRTLRELGDLDVVVVPALVQRLRVERADHARPHRARRDEWTPLGEQNYKAVDRKLVLPGCDVAGEILGIVPHAPDER